MLFPWRLISHLPLIVDSDGWGGFVGKAIRAFFRKSVARRVALRPLWNSSPENSNTDEDAIYNSQDLCVGATQLVRKLNCLCKQHL